MAAKTDWLTPLLSALSCILFAHSVQAHYCDNDRCSDEEYCCGDNMCCPSYKVWDLWYFWCGVLFFMFLLSLCACFWRYRFLSNGTIIISGYNYTPLQEVDVMGSRPDLTTGRYARSNNHLYTPPLGTPPPYNQISASNVKIAAPPPSYAQVVGMREHH